MYSVYEHVHPKKYFNDHVIQGVRPDGRKLLEYRPVSLNIDVIPNVNGSAVLKIGDTIITSIVKAVLIKKDPEVPMLQVNFASPLIQKMYLKNGLTQNEIRLCSLFLTKLFTELIDPKSLEVENEELQWILRCELICVNYDGGLWDSAVASLYAAIKTVKIPVIKFDKDVENFVEQDEIMNVNLKSCPVATTYGIFNDSVIIVDPTWKEEDYCGTVTFVSIDGKLYYTHKPGGNRIPEIHLKACIQQANKRCPLVKQLVQTLLKK